MGNAEQISSEVGCTFDIWHLALVLFSLVTDHSKKGIKRQAVVLTTSQGAHLFL